MSDERARAAVTRAALPLSAGLERVLARVGDAEVVLIGEASHGTHEFYRIRAEITRRLIVEEGFAAVAVEADWPDAWRAGRWVLGRSGDRSAEEALSGFERFPTWMWRNTDVVEFLQWLRTWNDGVTTKAGFYGLDLYSLHTSMDAVLEFLDRVDPEAARRARQRYGCFDHFGDDTRAYGYAAGYGFAESCAPAVRAQLLELQRAASAYREGGDTGRDEVFSAEQNARLVQDAELYYRTMFDGGASSWNLRDTHMADTLEQLRAHLRGGGRQPKVVVWAHNSHLGDARATEMGRGGELNLGQLARQRYPASCVNIGFTTYTGSVTAASNWDEPAQRKRVRDAMAGSYEALFHETGRDAFIVFPGSDELRPVLGTPRLERAIGVIYRPETERLSHWFSCNLAEQFDCVIHVDATRALVPLEPGERWDHGEPPETYPTGI